jgi:hypothetical protein
MGPGRTTGGDSGIQRGWLNPDHLWGSRSRPQPVTCSDPAYSSDGRDRKVSVRLLYLIFNSLLNRLTLLGRTVYVFFAVCRARRPR